MNQLNLVGRIVREIDIKELGDGKVVLNNTLAVKRKFKNEKGQPADFIPIVAWGQVAKLIQIYCEKGDLVGLTGHIQSRSYQNKEEETVFVVEMLVNEVDFLQGRRSTPSSSIEEMEQSTLY
ncbi:single-stranded DNA-binding protein [Carnobacterium funditum]|uniref:single-stranded DNA-binding protein n=1 Tax=Carnobacterium funditum TaxID=2752 RepID=UPI0005558D19|nr:single-stranded DNA-binding protein [Carnobacterium funditum]